MPKHRADGLADPALCDGGLGREVSVMWVGASGAGERVFSVDTSGWPAGAYAVRVTTGERSASARLVVAR